MMTVDTISYTTSESALGSVLVARSVSGVCAILIGADDDKLVADLAARFPEAELVANETVVRDDLVKVIRFVDDPSEGLDLPLDLRGTPFQRRVWATLRTIPVGSTMTYTEVARSIGAPNAVRAVASACASNPIALAIPCHRVVGSDGDLTGYRWGVERKHELLKKEAVRERALVHHLPCLCGYLRRGAGRGIRLAGARRRA
jgi:AraC family transcriptional regulator, regulatory protein of adaptative response / methylated-DNA-[protein]-cysteine methyltransferase